MAKILLTGGAGFIGSHVADLFLANGYEVVIVDDLSTGKKANLNSKATFYQLDICSPELADIFAKEKPDFINHHAAQINVRRSVTDPLLDAHINISGLLNVMECARHYPVKKIIFASSGGAIYGEAGELPTTEEYNPVPISPYGISKLASEYYLHYYYHLHHIPYVALRYGNVYGPRQDSQGEAGVIAIFTELMKANAQPLINGDGEQTRDYIYVADVAQANRQALEQNQIGIFNIGTGQETSVNRLFDELKNIIGFTGQKKHGPAAPGDVSRSALSIKKAQQLLGWQPVTPLEAGLKKVYEAT